MPRLPTHLVQELNVGTVIELITRLHTQETHISTLTKEC